MVKITLRNVLGRIDIDRAWYLLIKVGTKMMKKFLFALSALFLPFTSANAITYIEYTATGIGYGYVETGPDLHDKQQGIGTIFVHYSAVVYTEDFWTCLPPAVCSGGVGVHSSDLRDMYSRASLFFAPGAGTPLPTDPTKFLGGTASNFILLNGRDYLEFSGTLDHVTIKITDGSEPQPPSYFAVDFSFTPQPPPAVPEPTSWALMIVGIAMIGATLRRRHSVFGAVQILHVGLPPLSCPFPAAGTRH